MMINSVRGVQLIFDQLSFVNNERAPLLLFHCVGVQRCRLVPVSLSLSLWQQSLERERDVHLHFFPLMLSAFAPVCRDHLPISSGSTCLRATTTTNQTDLPSPAGEI